MRTVDADKLMERAKMHSIMVSTTLGHFDYGMTLGMLNEIVKECETSAPVGDTVSRQTVLNLLSTMPPEEAITKAMLIQGVKQMSAAQPYTDEEIKKIQELEQAQFEKMYELGYQAGRMAQPERKRGKWIYGEDEYGIDGYHCDKCGFFVPWDYAHKFINYIEDYKFCPNCGADMREVDVDERPD